MDEQKSTVIVSDEHTRAVMLTRSIVANAQAAQQSLYEVCKGLKEMRDWKLYKELGYSSFEEYCENEVGIKRHQAMKYAAIAELENVESTQHFGTEKLYLLAKLDEPTRQEITESVNVENITVKDLKATIAQLQADKEENEHAAELLSEELEAAKEEIDAEKERRRTLLDRIRQLVAEVAELKNNPVQVAAEDTTRIEELTEEIAELKRQLAEKPMVQEALPTETYTDGRKEFEAYLRVADEAVGQVFKCLCRQGNKVCQKTLGGIAIRKLEKYLDLFTFKEES